MKRLGIFFMQDSDGIVDDYVFYLLQEIRKVLEHLTVISSEVLTQETLTKMALCTNEVFVQGNPGFNIEAWKQGILQNEANLPEYDELVLFDDSFYGPMYPFEEVFQQMAEKSDADFWGITIRGKTEDTENLSPYGHIPEHLQPYFLVIREKMFHSGEFLAYWQNKYEEETFPENLRFNEINFTKKFSDMGFKYAAFCDTRHLEQLYDSTIDHSIISAEILLRRYKCPVIKKKVFLTSREDYLQENYGAVPRRCLEFVKDYTNYEPRLIWQNLIRKQNIAATKINLALDYFLPNKNLIADVQAVLREAVIIAHLFYEDLMPECIEYLCRAPREIPIIVTVSSEERKVIAEKLFKAAGRYCEIRVVPNRGRDLSALLVSCIDVFDKFKYLCFVHDKKSLRREESVAVGRAFFHLLWDNVLNSEIFIKNVLATFENEPQLGLLVPPQPYNSKYKAILFNSKYWSGACFDKTVELAEKLDIPLKFLSTEYVSLSIGSVFWCRTEALSKITDFAWDIEDFDKEPMPTDGTISHALERIFPFAAQAVGFYTGQLMTMGFAKDELENFILFSLSSVKVPEPPPVKDETEEEPIDKPRPLIIEEPRKVNLTKIKPLLITIPQELPEIPKPPRISLTALTKETVPEKYWYLLRPIKRLLQRMGLNP